MNILRKLSSCCSQQRQFDDEDTKMDIDWEVSAEKRSKWRLPSYIVCCLAAAGIIAYGAIENTEIEYRAVRDEQNKNGTTTCYTRKDKRTFPVLFNLGFGLLGIFLGTFVDRLCTVIEELFQYKSRCSKDIYVLFKSCFSGINWFTVLVVLGVLGGSIGFGHRTSPTYADLIYVLGGIGIGPLVEVSRILEEKEMYPGHTLAWSYFFNHLMPAINALSDRIKEIENPSHVPKRNEVKLSLNKLLLLLQPSTDLVKIEELITLDGTIVVFVKILTVFLFIASESMKTYIML